MKSWVLASASAAILGFCAPAAFAETAAKPADKPAPAATTATTGAKPSAEALAAEATKGQAPKPKVIDFEDETIRGTLTKPEGDFIDARRRMKQKSLIKVRPHFVPELLKSADEL